MEEFEILFKSNYNVFVIEDDRLTKYPLSYLSHDEVNTTKYLEDVKPMFHYIRNGKYIPVYYEYNNRFITFMQDHYDWLHYTEEMVKDYTLVNLNLLDGSNI